MVFFLSLCLSLSVLTFLVQLTVGNVFYFSFSSEADHSCVFVIALHRKISVRQPSFPLRLFPVNRNIFIIVKKIYRCLNIIVSQCFSQNQRIRCSQVHNPMTQPPELPIFVQSRKCPAVVKKLMWCWLHSHLPEKIATSLVCHFKEPRKTSVQVHNYLRVMIQVEIPDKKHLNLSRTKQLLVQTIVGRNREDWEWSEVRRYFLTHSAVYGVSIYTGHVILEILFFYNLCASASSNCQLHVIL